MHVIRHFLADTDLKQKEIFYLIDKAGEIKKNPEKFSSALAGKTLLMIFAKPSLRTRVSFETGMTQLGGHAIYYDISTSPLVTGKETIADTAQTLSRYVDLIMARLFEHKELEELARYSQIPVINGLTNLLHPCQILSDLMTIHEKKGKVDGIELSYVGDGNNNVTHSLIYAGALTGMHVTVACPKDAAYRPNAKIISQARKYPNAHIDVVHDATEAVKGADVVYTDSWMSYHIPASQKKKRAVELKEFQVNTALMKNANKNAIFMHCLPCQRGMEVTADVIDGSQSIVFDQAENRLHMQKAIMLWLLGKLK